MAVLGLMDPDFLQSRYHPVVRPTALEHRSRTNGQNFFCSADIPQLLHFLKEQASTLYPVLS